MISYGTSGFRDKSEIIKNISYDIGRILAYIVKKNNTNYGIMITASHNMYLDNGVKIVNHEGEMINKDDEKIIESYVNSNFDLESLPNLLESKTIFIGRDTRNSGIDISLEIKNGIKSYCNLINIKDFNMVTTPQHHYLVHKKSFNKLDYINKFYILNDLDLYTKSLLIDCANGIGYLALKDFKIDLNLINTDINNYEKLNNNCGSDFVISENEFPSNFINNKLGCSLDGDADRFIFYFNDNGLKILDGDYIGALYLLSILKHNELMNLDCSIGYIHSPYTNSGLINWIKNLNKNVNIECTAPGVKNLHKKAIKYDIGIYFESNGHGTMLINTNLLKYHFLKIFNLINNQVIGDGISGIFCVIYCLVFLNINLKEWFNLFQKKDCLLYKKKVNDKNLFKTNKIGNKLIEPIDLQNDLDIINKDNNCISFIRPSGTEDVIRIYIEGDNLNKIKENIELNLDKYIL